MINENHLKIARWYAKTQLNDCDFVAIEMIVKQLFEWECPCETGVLAYLNAVAKHHELYNTAVMQLFNGTVADLLEDLQWLPEDTLAAWVKRSMSGAYVHSNLGQLRLLAILLELSPHSPKRECRDDVLRGLSSIGRVNRKNFTKEMEKFISAYNYNMGRQYC